MAATQKKVANLTASQIIRALQHSRHAEDIFIPECKTGPSAGTRHHRIDAWAMKRSYSNPLISAYEVKVTRADFLQDTKWHRYLPYCNQFYWATPWNLVQPEEMSGDAGLLWVTNTGNRCVVKRKAAHRDLELSLDPPYGIFIYLLYSRAAFHGEGSGTRECNIDRWKFWMDRKIEARDLGASVSRRLSRTVREEIEKVGKENKALRDENNALSDIRKFVTTELSIDPDDLRSWYAQRTTRMVKERLNTLDKFIPQDLEMPLRTAVSELHTALKRAEDALEGIRKLKNPNKNA